MYEKVIVAGNTGNTTRCIEEADKKDPPPRSELSMSIKLINQKWLLSLHFPYSFYVIIFLIILVGNALVEQK